VILKVDGKEISRANRPDIKPDQELKLTVKRQAEEKIINVKVGSRGVASYKIVEVASPTSEQTRVRERWLRASPQ
jgi:hypothetical protein